MADEHTNSDVIRLDDGDHVGTGGLPDTFEDPGLPPHVPRASDLSEAGAKRAERQVALLFTISIVGTLLFLVAYFAVPQYSQVFVPILGNVDASNLSLGLGLTLALLGIGLGAVHWAKTLMPDVEEVEMRHPQRSAAADRDRFIEIMTDGNESSQLGRRPLIKRTLVGAVGLFSVPLLVQLVGSLGPFDNPEDKLSRTFWDGPLENGKAEFQRPRLVRDPLNTPIKAEDVTIGSVFHVLPEGLLDLEHGVLEEKAKAAVLLMRLDPRDIRSQKEREWGHEGIVAYSKICTHVGCPVGLYEQQTHHLLCPCHQSTFDVTNDCEVIFGPAKRPLAQLKITVDDQGYLVADQPFQEPVGPSFWERG